MNRLERPNLLPGLLIVLGVISLFAVGGWYAWQPQEDLLQGQAEVAEYRVSGKVPGRVLRIYVEEGQTVHAGDTLAVLEAPDVQAKLQQAEAAEQMAAAGSRKAEAGARREQIAAAYEMWQKAKAGSEISEKSYKRVKNLFEEGVVTAQKLDEALAQRDAALATERAARAQYEQAENGARQEDRDAARAGVARAKGAVAEVDSYMKETVLVAPEDGEVTDIYPEPGELVGTGAPIMSVGKMQQLWISFNVREDKLSRLPMNATVEVSVPALGGRRVKCRVYSVKDRGAYAAWKATKSTGQYDMKTFEVKVRPLQPVEGLRPGMSVLSVSK